MKDPNELTPAQKQDQADFEKKLTEEHQMTFTKGQLIVLFNVLTKIQFVYGDFLAVGPIIEKLKPIVAADSNATAEQTAKAQEELKNHVMLGKKTLN